MTTELACGAALVRLLWLTSPALPIGAYAYSRGLEHAVCNGAVHDAQTAGSWVRALLTRQVSRLDVPVLGRLHRAFCSDDLAAVSHWCHELRAFRETAELAREDQQLGIGLTRVLRGLDRLQGVPEIATQSYVAMFAHAAVAYGVSARAAASGLLFSCAESQITVASKLIPLGQTEAQRVLSSLLAEVDGLADSGLSLADDALGSYTPGVAMASALHETQYSRLYRS